MRSSFNNVAVVKRVTLTLIAAAVAVGSNAFSNPAAHAAQLDANTRGSLSLITRDSVSGGRCSKTFSVPLATVTARGGNERILIAQGDATLPPPDPNYRPKSRFGSDGVPAAQFAGDADNLDGPIRRRIRRRLQQERLGNGGAVDNIGGNSDVSGRAPGAAFGNGALTGAAVRFGGNRQNRPAGSGPFGDGAIGGGGNRQNRPAGSGPFGDGAFGGGGNRQNRPAGGGPFAGGAFGGGGNLLGKRPLDLTSLNLTPDQKQRIQDMRRQLAPKTRELRKTLNAKRQELRDLMFEPTAADDQVRSKRKEVRQLQDKIEELQLNDFLSIRSVLTADQRSKLSDLKPGNKFAAGNNQPQLIAPAVSSPTP